MSTLYVGIFIKAFVQLVVTFESKGLEQFRHVD